MVWLNTQCINETPPPGYFGGSMCTCPKCKEERAAALDEEIDLAMKKDFKSHKMIPEQLAIAIIRDCIDRPKGIVPDSVYATFPDIKF